MVRRLVSIPAGIDGMPRVPFLIYTALGSAVWNAALIGTGYALGGAWQNVREHSGVLNAVVVVALVLAVLWFVVSWLRRRRGRRAQTRGPADVPAVTVAWTAHVRPPGGRCRIACRAEPWRARPPKAASQVGAGEHEGEPGGDGQLQRPVGHQEPLRCLGLATVDQQQVAEQGQGDGQQR